MHGFLRAQDIESINTESYHRLLALQKSVVNGQGGAKLRDALDKNDYVEQ